MVSLTVGNSYSRVTGLTPQQEAVVRKALSYKIQDPRGGGYSFRQTTRYLIDKKGSFPTGLLKTLQHTLNTLEVQTEVQDTRIMPLSSSTPLFSLKLPFNPYKEQVHAATAGSINYRGTITMPTGSGKSVTMALLVFVLQLKTLIVVPNLTLKRQLTESFTQYFGSLNNITIENIDSPNLKKNTHYDVLIIDEAHHVAAKTYRDLNKKYWNSIYYRLFFTATPYRGREEEQLLMESISGEVIYSLDYKTAVKAGMILPVEAYYIDLPKIPVKGKTWPTVYKEICTHRGDRNEMLTRLGFNLYLGRKSVLILVKEIAHGEQLTNEGAYGFANGKDENTGLLLEEFSNGERKILIGTNGVCGEGVDTKACEYVVIAGMGKSKPQFMQMVGRALRRFPGKESAKVILIRDKSHKWGLTHFNAQCKVLLDEFGVKPIKVEMQIEEIQPRESAER